MDLDLPTRGTTEKFVTVQKGSAASFLCGAVFLILSGTGIGFAWLWASKEVAPPEPLANVTLTPNATQTGSPEWSEWYRVNGIITITVQVIMGLSIVTQVILSCNSHYAKAQLYKTQGRDEEAQAEEDEEGCCIHMVEHFHGMLSCFQGCLGCVPLIWCCVGLFMIMFGLGWSVRVEPGYNDNSQYFLSILGLQALANSVALCCFCCVVGAGITGTAIAAGGTLDDDAEE